MLKPFFAFALLGGLAVLSPGPAAVAAPKAPAAETPAGATASPARPLPFHGTVTAVDPLALTMTLNGAGKGRVFIVSEQTTFIGRDGQPTTLSAVPVGEDVRGSAFKNGDRWTAHRVTIGAKDAAGAIRLRPTPGPAGPAAPHPAVAAAATPAAAAPCAEAATPAPRTPSLFPVLRPPSRPASTPLQPIPNF